MKDQHTAYIHREPLKSSVPTLGFFIRMYFMQGIICPRFTRGGLRSTFPLDAPDFSLGSQILRVVRQNIGRLARRLGAQLGLFTLASQFDTSSSDVSRRLLALYQMPTRNEDTIRSVHKNGTRIQAKFP